MPDIRAKVALSATGAYTATTYRQRLDLQETWERGQHEAVEVLDCDHYDSDDFISNVLGTVWYNRNTASGVSRVIPKSYPFRSAMYGSVQPDVFSAIPSYTGATYPLQIRAYNRPWYAYRMELASMDGVPLQWQSGGGYRLIGKGVTSLTANEISGVDTVSDGRESYRVYYKPMRYMLRTDTEMAALGNDVNDCELGRFVIRDYRFSARNLTLPPNYLYWASDLNTGTGALTAGAVPIPEGATKVFPVIQVLMTWVDVPWLPFSNINSYVGKINAAVTTTADNTDGSFDAQATIDSTNWPLRKTAGFAPGKLLFDGVHDLVEETNAAGQWVCSITYSFLYRETGWNYFFDFKRNGFYEAVTKDSIGKAQANWTKLYDTANFNNLFKLPIA